MVILMMLAALTGQPIAAPGDSQLNIGVKELTRIEELAEKLCPRSFATARQREWFATMGKQQGLTMDAQVVLMSQCVLYSQGRLDERRRRLGASRRSNPKDAQ